MIDTKNRNAAQRIPAAPVAKSQENIGRRASRSPPSSKIIDDLAQSPRGDDRVIAALLSIDSEFHPRSASPDLYRGRTVVRGFSLSGVADGLARGDNAYG